MPYANREGPNELAHPCSLIWIFSVRLTILQYPLILKADIEGPGCADWSGLALSANCIRALFVRHVLYDIAAAFSIFRTPYTTCANPQNKN